MANVGKMMKLGFTYLILWAVKLRINDGIWIHLSVPVGWRPRKNDDIRIHLPFPVCWQT
jgi:hypothetical protein